MGVTQVFSGWRVGDLLDHTRSEHGNALKYSLFFAIWAVLIRAECTSSKTFAESPAAYFYSYGILSGKLRAAIPLYFFNPKEL